MFHRLLQVLFQRLCLLDISSSSCAIIHVYVFADETRYIVGEERTNFVGVVAEDDSGDQCRRSGAKDVREKLFDEDLLARLIFKPKIPKDLPVTFVDVDLMEEAGYISHEGDWMLSKAGEDVNERIDKVWTTEEEVIETDAINTRAGVVTHMYLVMLVHGMHREVPLWKLRIHLVVGDVDCLSFVVKFLHLLEHSSLEDRVALESWNLLIWRDEMPFPSS